MPGTELRQRIHPDGTIWVEWRDDGSTRAPIRVGPLTDNGIEQLALLTGWCGTALPGITPKCWVLLHGNSVWKSK